MAYFPLENGINVNKHKLLMMMLLSFETLFSRFEVLTNSLMALLGTNVCEALDRVCSECQIYQVLENTSLFSTSQVWKSINRVVMPDGSKKKLVELRGRIEMKWMKTISITEDLVRWWWVRRVIHESWGNKTESQRKTMIRLYVVFTSLLLSPSNLMSCMTRAPWVIKCDVA